jgi:hypothetical protein
MKTPEITIVPRLSYEVLIDGKSIGTGMVTGELDTIVQLKVGKHELCVLREPGLDSLLNSAIGTGKPEVVSFIKGTPVITAQIKGTTPQSAEAPKTGEGAQTA